jgi:drug/metabolite transporter (DMT)-like permease
VRAGAGDGRTGDGRLPGQRQVGQAVGGRGRAEPRTVLFGLPRAELAMMLTTVALWSSLHPVGKLALAEVTTTGLAFARIGLACVALLAVCAATGRLGLVLAAFHPRVAGSVVALGLSGFSASSWLSMTSLGYLPAGVNSLFANASPLIVALATTLLLKERVGRRTVAGIAIGFVGVSLVALRGGVEASQLHPVGIALALAGSAVWAGYTALGRRLLAGRDTLAMGAAASLVGAVPVGLGLAYEGGFGPLLGASAWTHGLLLWCGVVATGVTYSGWVFLLKRVHAARVASFQYLIPLLALALAYPLVGEEPTVPVLLGALLIIAGVAIANSRR